MHNNLVQVSTQKAEKEFKQGTHLASEVARLLVDKGLTLATAESCTGGAIGALLTAQAGSSSWFNGGVISYSNNAKINLLGVPKDIIHQHGAVSQEVVEHMAIGGCAALKSSMCVAVTGVAGPSGGTPAKPVGTVWIAWCTDGVVVKSQVFQFPGNRQAVQTATVHMALKEVINCLLED